MHFCLHALCELRLILEAYFSDVHWLWQDFWSQSHEFVTLRCPVLILILTSLSIICRAYSFQQIVFGQMERRTKHAKIALGSKTVYCSGWSWIAYLGFTYIHSEDSLEVGEPFPPKKNVTFDPFSTCEMWSNRDADGFRLESSGWAQFFLYQILRLGWWRKQLVNTLHIHVEQNLAWLSQCSVHLLKMT